MWNQSGKNIPRYDRVINIDTTNNERKDLVFELTL